MTMFRSDIDKSSHYKLKGKFILGEKWMDTKGTVWTIDDITDHFIIIEGEIEERHILKKIDLDHYNDFLNFRIC